MNKLEKKLDAYLATMPKNEDQVYLEMEFLLCQAYPEFLEACPMRLCSDFREELVSLFEENDILG